MTFWTIILLIKPSYEELKYWIKKLNLKEDYLYDLNYGFVVSKNKISLLVIKNFDNFINTFEHEKNHIEMYICKEYNINPFSEEASYLSGDLSEILFKTLYKNLYKFI